MKGLSRRQKQVLEFVREKIEAERIPPTLREIADNFGFRSVKAAADHLRALRKKGFVDFQPFRARSVRILSPLDSFRSPTVDIPLYSTAPEKFPDEEVKPEGCITVDIDTLGVPKTAKLFALKARGDSMAGRNIFSGDYVILEYGRTPRNGEVVAALVNKESVLRAYVKERGSPAMLKAEASKPPKPHPAAEAVIQGVMVALIRRAKSR
ncbi:MAG: repressor LexA [Verrucomicrobia bacterium]|nr:repressor LexA [Verrucomicrobiota bacterium]